MYFDVVQSSRLALDTGTDKALFPLPFIATKEFRYDKPLVSYGFKQPLFSINKSTISSIAEASVVLLVRRKGNRNVKASDLEEFATGMCVAVFVSFRSSPE
jgi:hypothetical protein